MSRPRWPGRRPSSASSRPRRPRRSPPRRGSSCSTARASTRASPAPATRSCRWSGNCRRVVGEPHGGWVHWGATTQNITQTGDLLVLRQAHRVFLRLIGEALAAAGRSRRARRRHADRRPHARPARGAGDLRLQGRGVDRRAAAPCRAAAAGGAAPVRRDAGRRRRHLRLARRAGAGGAGRHRPASRLAAR